MKLKETIMRELRESMHQNAIIHIMKLCTSYANLKKRVSGVGLMYFCMSVFVFLE